MPHLASVVAPLYNLLQKKKHWHWETVQDTAFKEAKKLVTSDSLLVHFDVTNKLLLACDACPYGLRAVLSHWNADGTEHPIAFASRSLSAAEHKYVQLDKEGLAIIFGV